MQVCVCVSLSLSLSVYVPVCVSVCVSLGIFLPGFTCNTPAETRAFLQSHLRVQDLQLQALERLFVQHEDVIGQGRTLPAVHDASCIASTRHVPKPRRTAERPSPLTTCSFRNATQSLAGVAVKAPSNVSKKGVCPWPPVNFEQLYPVQAMTLADSRGNKNLKQVPEPT